jgi:hypothetical protein
MAMVLLCHDELNNTYLTVMAMVLLWHDELNKF